MRCRLEDGSGKPIEYASRILSMAEGKFNYTQFEKQGLAIVFGIKSSTFTFIVMY